MLTRVIHPLNPQYQRNKPVYNQQDLIQFSEIFQFLIWLPIVVL